MTFSVFQAVTCFAAARTMAQGNPDLFAKYGVTDMEVHNVANGMDDCISYSSHKYFDVEPINWFMNRPEGFGAYGHWRFKDKSRLIALCGNLFCVAREVDDRKVLLDMRDFPFTTRAVTLL